VDQYVSCDADALRTRSATLPEDADTTDQHFTCTCVHRHTGRCGGKTQKKRAATETAENRSAEGVKTCTFSYPMPPMRETTIFTPMTKEDTGYNVARKNWKFIRGHLLSLPLWDNACQTTFDEFLVAIAMDYNTYCAAVRTSLKRPTVLLRRKVRDINVNACSPRLYHLLQVNLDQQFLLEPYAAAYYITDYICKEERGSSEFVREINASLIDATGAARQKQLMKVVRAAGFAFMRWSEIGIQLAVMLALGLPLFYVSRGHVHVSTKTEDDRTRIMLPMSKLKGMNEDDTNVFCEGMMDRYRKSQDIYKAVSLADFACKYRSTRSSAREEDNEDDVDAVDEDEREVQEAARLALADNGDDNESDVNDAARDAALPDLLRDAYGTQYVRRKRAAILLSGKFSNDTNEAARQRILLYVKGHGTDGTLPSLIARGFAEAGEDCSDVLQRHQSQALQGARSYEQMSASMWESIMEEVRNRVDAVESDDDDDDVAAARHALTADEDAVVPGEPSREPRVAAGKQRPLRTLQDYYDDMRKLTRQQRKFLYGMFRQHIRGVRHTVFLSGGAGVGKTFVTMLLSETVRRYENSKRSADPDDMCVRTLSMWGNPAFNAGGTTVHDGLNFRASSDPSNHHLPESVLNTLRCTYRRLLLLFIEEVSTMGWRFHIATFARLQRIKQSSLPYGGVSMLFNGDLYQAKCVMDEWIFKPVPGPTSNLQPNVWINEVKMFELTEVMRQSDAADANLLNRMRVNALTAADLARLEGLRISVDSRNYNIPYAYCTNAEVNTHNDEVFTRQPLAEQRTYAAIDSVTSDASASEIAQLLTNLKNREVKKTANLVHQLRIAKGMYIDCIATYDAADGIRNGAYGQVVRCTNDFIYVRFVNPRAGAMTRASPAIAALLLREGLPSDVTPVHRVTKDFQIGKSAHTVLRRQFPFKAGNARTADRWIGTTISGPFGVDMSRVSTRRGSGNLQYVACSRARRVDDLEIVDGGFLRIRIPPELIQEMHRLRTEALITLPIPDLASNAATFTLVVQNARSLAAHAADASAESYVQDADVVMFCETRVRSGNDLQLNGMSSWHLHARGRSNPTHGLGVFWKVGNDVSCLHRSQTAEFDIAHVQVITAEPQQQPIHVVFAYRAPHTGNVDSFCNAVVTFIRRLADETGTKVFTGDINFDALHTGIPPSIAIALAAAGLTAAVNEPTTYLGAQLDVMFVSDAAAGMRHASGTLECYWSDHRPMYMQVLPYE
jgi:hypothetical protein